MECRASKASLPTTNSRAGRLQITSRTSSRVSCGRTETAGPELELDLLLEYLSLRPQPCLRLICRRSLRPNYVPESGRVIGLEEMRKLVRDHVVDHEYRRL